MKNCPYCSAEILDEAEFCLHCMRQLTPKTIVTNKQKKPYWLIAVLGVLLALLTCAIILLIIQSGANSTQDHISSGDESVVIYTTQSGVPSDNGSIDAANNSSDVNALKNNSVDNNSDTNPNQTPADDKVVSDDKNADNTTTENSATDDDTSSPEDNDTSSQNSSISSSGSADSSTSDADSSTQTSTSTSSDDNREQSVQTWAVKAVSGGVEISGIANYNTSGSYVIPSQIDGKTVIGIGFQAFYYEQNLKSIVLPDTIKYIDEQAFANCNSLTEITIPKGVTEIRYNAFMFCDRLADIYIASTNVSIASTAFSNSYQRSVLLTLHAPSSVMTDLKARAWDADYKEWNG